MYRIKTEVNEITSKERYYIQKYFLFGIWFTQYWISIDIYLATGIINRSKYFYDKEKAEDLIKSEHIDKAWK